MNRDQEMTPERRAWLQAEYAKLDAKPRRLIDQTTKGPLSAFDIMDLLKNYNVYTDAAGNAWFHWIELPEALRDEEFEKNQTNFQCLVPVPSKKLRSLLVTWLHYEEIAGLEPGAIDEVLAVLEGLAFLNPERCELETAVETNPILEALLALLESEPDWEGTATELLTALAKVSSEREWNLERQPHWPLNASALSRSLSNLEPYMREAGFVHEFHRFEKRRRHSFGLISITNKRTSSRNRSIKGEQPANATSPSNRLSVPAASPNEKHSSSTPDVPSGSAVTHDANDGNDGISTAAKMPSSGGARITDATPITSDYHDGNDANDDIFAVVEQTA